MRVELDLPKKENQEKWWEVQGKPSRRFSEEYSSMVPFFKGGPIVLGLPPSSWDLEKIAICNQSAEARRINGLSFDRNTGCDVVYDLAWFVNFSMDDGRFCRPDEKWKIISFYPITYPYSPPKISIFNCTRDYWVYDEHHHLYEMRLDNNEHYPVACHTSYVYHSPGFTSTFQHIIRAILFLRARLDKVKNNRAAMLSYGE